MPHGVQSAFDATSHQSMLSCIEACQHCAQVCLSTTQHCLEMGGNHARPDHIRTMMDCADMCEISARFMSRRSPQHYQTCAMCAELCLRCGTECANIQDDEAMIECANACRRCEQECRRMSAQ